MIKGNLVRLKNQGTNVHSAPGLTGTATGYSPIKLVSASQSQQDAVKTSSYDWFVFRYAEILLIYAEAKCELGECTQAVLDETINKLRDRVEMRTFNSISSSRSESG